MKRSSEKAVRMALQLTKGGGREVHVAYVLKLAERVLEAKKQAEVAEHALQRELSRLACTPSGEVGGGRVATRKGKPVLPVVLAKVMQAEPSFPFPIRMLCERAGTDIYKECAVHSAMAHMARKGLVKRIKRGVYRWNGAS